jgi:hypothetical protein
MDRPKEEMEELLRTMAEDLLEVANELNYSVEIILQPTYPLRMGGYEPVVHLRPKRK